MKKSLYLIALLLAACSSEQETFTHTLNHHTGLTTGTIFYIQEATGIGATGALDLMEASEPILMISLDSTSVNLTEVETGNYTISLKNESGVSSFTEIPEKYLNMNAGVYFSRKVYESNFPQEWAPMKGTDYTTLYISSAQDNQVFYIQVVATGTNKKIAMHSEDY
ncbi:MAG: hypothetical protein HOI49_10865 [Bacteroidetes bacterium]|jgi:hypothetical protein|nr:hypothetical protein [Bacteroidota bacterium]